MKTKTYSNRIRSIIIRIQTTLFLGFFVSNFSFSQGCIDTSYSLCNGQTYTLTAQSGLTGYQWHTINGTDTLPISGATNQMYIVSSPGTYIWTALDNTNCVNLLCCPLKFDTLNCNCNAQPYPICSGESYTLTADAGLFGYQWYTISGIDTLPISGATNQIYIATAVGKYIWRASDIDNCPNELCCPVEIVAGTCTCSIALTANPTSCTPTTNTYSLSGQLTITSFPSTGTLTVNVSGGGSQTFNAPFTSLLSYSISGLTADGAIHTVSAVFSADANCTNTTTFTAPISCLLVCSVNISASPGSCIPASNTYNLNGQLTFTNPPSSGTLTVSVEGNNQVFNAPFTSPLSYSISGLTADGASHTVSAVFSADANCTNNTTYTSPIACNCIIANVGLTILNCNNKGTLTNANDDEFTFTLNPTGSGLGTTYTVNGLPNSPQTGTYGSPTTFGPYLISAGVLSISVIDNTTSGCSQTATITPPPSCSVCNLNPPVLTINDNICPSRTGTINVVQGCGAGTFIQYSINNGTSWTTVMPLYSTTPITIFARCVNSADTTCKSSVMILTTNPIKCTPSSGNECSLIANATVDPCNDNNTNDVTTDDYFTVQINANVTNGGSSNKYEVVIGADPTTGIGGNILNSGGTTYGSPVTIGNTKIFKADGLTSYQLIIRDINNNNCFQNIQIDPVNSCSNTPPISPCYPVPCVPIQLIKN